MDRTEKNIDQLIKKHLKQKDAEFTLGQDFNDRLMNKITDIHSQSQNVYSGFKASIYLPMVLLFSLLVVSFIYLLTQVNLEVFSFDLSVDKLSFLDSKGVKYSIYALTALLIFSIIDQFSTHKWQNSNK